jgi:rhodanese-related sulfurtransferase
MSLLKVLVAVLILAACAAVAAWDRSRRRRLFFQSHSIDVERLRALLFAGRPDDAVEVIDVRQPLDLLAYSVIIPGSRRIPPKDILENPDLIRRDQETIVYCTCNSDEASIKIMRKAVALGFDKIKFLHGGLDAWKQRNYPVEPYRHSFHLDTPA